MTRPFPPPRPAADAGTADPAPPASQWEIALPAGTPVFALAGELAVDLLVPGDRLVARSGAVRLVACRTEWAVPSPSGCAPGRLVRLRFDRAVTLVTPGGDRAARPVLRRS
jgi:hypothetical protein